MTTTPGDDLLTEVERSLRERFKKDDPNQRVPSSAHAAARSKRVDQLVLPDTERAKMPLTKDKYLVKENPDLVAWERETRKFLRQLTPKAGHRVSAVMVYEWATGINVAQLMAEGGSAAAHLRKINQVLRHHFGKPYSTYIAGRKVPNCYRVPVGWHVKRHRPMTLTLATEYWAGVLNP